MVKKAPKKTAAKKKAAPKKTASKAASSKTELASEAVASATLRHVRISAQKARLVVDMVRGVEVERALDILDYSPKKGARLVAKLLRSAISNARDKGSVDVDNLLVVGAWVNEGRTMKRYLPRARGSANEIKKRSSHITLQLGERK